MTGFGDPAGPPVVGSRATAPVPLGGPPSRRSGTGSDAFVLAGDKWRHFKRLCPVSRICRHRIGHLALDDLTFVSGGMIAFAHLVAFPDTVDFSCSGVRSGPSVIREVVVGEDVKSCR